MKKIIFILKSDSIGVKFIKIHKKFYNVLLWAKVLFKEEVVLHSFLVIYQSTLITNIN
jgi:hypothetical protein